MAGEKLPVDPEYLLGAEAPQRTRNPLAERAIALSHKVADKLPRLTIKPSPEREREQFVTIFDKLTERGLSSQEVHEVFDHNLPHGSTK